MVTEESISWEDDDSALADAEERQNALPKEEIGKLVHPVKMVNDESAIAAREFLRQHQIIMTDPPILDESTIRKIDEFDIRLLGICKQPGHKGGSNTAAKAYMLPNPKLK